MVRSVHREGARLGDLVTTLRLPLVLSSIGLCLALSCNDAAAASGRQTTEPVVARVLQVSGQVQIKPAGAAAFAAADNTDLVASDRIDPGEGAYAIVGLENGYVVRVDDTGALAVKNIVMLKAPPTSMSVEEQLTKLTDLPKDFNRKAVTEKAAAWRHMPRAAQSALSDADGAGGGGAAPAAESVAQPVTAAADSGDSATDDAPMRDEAEPVRQGNGGNTGRKASQTARSGNGSTSDSKSRGGSSSTPSSKERRAKDEISDLLTGPRSANEGPAPSPAPEPVVKAPVGGVPATAMPPAPTPQAAPKQTTLTPTPAPMVRVGASIEAALKQPENPASQRLAEVLSPLGACRDVVVAELRVPPEAISFRVLVKRSQIIRVSLGGALPTPTCTQPLLGQAVDGADGWYVVTLP